MWNILCWKRNRARGPCNEIRIIEFVLCVVCFALTLHFLDSGYISFSIFLVLFSAIIFLFITLVDIIVITAWFPIGWRAWIMISLSGALLFFTNFGMSFLIYQRVWWVGSIFYMITAIVFLLDALCIICLVRNHDDSGTRTCSTACKSSQIVPTNRPAQLQAVPPVQAHPARPAQEHMDKYQQTQYSASCKVPDGGKCGKRQTAPAMSYGGTFHMSKDTTPMPSPQTMPKTMTNPQLDDCSCVAVEEDITSHRTVAVTAKMGPQKTRDIDLTPLKSPFTCDATKKTTVRKMKRVQFVPCKHQCRQGSTTSNSSRINDSENISPRCSPQFISRNKS